jgi:hypothetical protein
VLTQKNTKKQGDVGVGCAIRFFSELGATVCVPLTDSQDYDLVVELAGKLQRVQVKTTRYRNKYGRFSISLSIKGGNRSGAEKIKKLDVTAIDAIYIITEDNQEYFIPIAEVGAKNSLVLGHAYEKFKWRRGPNGLASCL